MSTYEPTHAEITVTRLVGGTLASAFYRRFIDRLPLQGSEHMLDFGSGSGVCTQWLVRRLQHGGRLTCVDISSRWIEVARQTLHTYDNIEYHLGEIQHLCLPAGSFDAVLIHFVLHDIPASGRQAIAGELARLLKAGGKLFVREPIERGAPPAEAIQELLQNAGLREVSQGWDSHWFTGKIYEGMYQKD